MGGLKTLATVSLDSGGTQSNVLRSCENMESSLSPKIRTDEGGLGIVINFFLKKL